MTTVKQSIQARPAKANELFARLGNTSDGAVKTRERVFTTLKEELELLAKLDEAHLLPVLRKHKETKHLVSDALKENKQTRKLLANLERTPPGREDFAQNVAELRKAFQQSVRDGRKNLFPGVLKALGEQEVKAIFEKIEDDRAEVQASKRAETQERRKKAKDEREQADALAAHEQNGIGIPQDSDHGLQADDAIPESSRQIAQTASKRVRGLPGASKGVTDASINTGSFFWNVMFGIWGFPQAFPRRPSEERSPVSLSR